MKPEVPTVKEAVGKFLHDLEHGQQRKAATLQKHKNLLEKRLLPWCVEKGFRLLKQLDTDALREFRSGWPDSPITAQKNLERLRAFFWFSHSAGWVKSNPATAVKAPKAGKPSERVKVFTEDQIQRVLKACAQYPARNAYGHDNPARVLAFVLPLRYSGLRIGDCVGLKKENLENDRLFLRTQKSGESVYVPLPKVTVAALKKIENGGEHFFWTGNGLRKSAVADWQRSLRRVFEDAKITGNAHMFRHTFATDLLARGVPIEDVAILLGHATPIITAKYYSHFVKERRERLEDRVRALWV
ncbi:MAG: site-specific integrase [Candidatus Binatus sp.]|uniref:tyrosine-type recombinase/integrase n=1 Tax=Candidatus Binatus sp. TaxID=2811406 RepID=UPI00271725C5|nr:site-specific integrase [Candidatus Binatus sp.]MDO8430781.1 site-specific integrase [Candidatus Binatus sp.]